MVEYLSGGRIQGSSTVEVTPSYNSVTSTFSSATFNNSSFASYDSTNNEIDFQAYVNSSQQNGAFAIDMLSGNVSDTAWVMRMKVNFSNIGGGNGSNISFNIAKNGHTTSNATAENILGWAWGEPPTDGGTGSGQNYIGIRQGTDSSGASASNYPVNTSGWYTDGWEDSAENTDYYIELKRTSATDVEFTVWEDSYGGTQKVNISRTDIPSGTVDLRYFKFCNRSNNGQPRTGNTSGALKELKFYNNTTSATEDEKDDITNVPDNTRYEETDTRKIYRRVIDQTKDEGMTGDNDAETSYLVYKQITGLPAGSIITDVRIDVYSCSAGAKFAVGVYDETGSNYPDNLLYNGANKCVGIFTQSSALSSHTTITCPLDYPATVPANGKVWVAGFPDEATHWRVNTGTGVYTDSVYHTTSPSPTTRHGNWADYSPNGTWVMKDDALYTTSYGGNNIRMGVEYTAWLERGVTA